MNIDKDRILNEVRPLAGDLTRYSEAAQLDSFLLCYAETPDFLAVSADGMIRNYKDFDAFFKNGDVMKMQNYSVTFLYKKISGESKVIHSHESALPPLIIKSK